MPPISSAICFLLGFIITFFALAPWYVEQFLAILHQAPWEPTFFVVTGLAVFSNALLVSGLGKEPPWLDHLFATAIAVAVTWIAGIFLAFGTLTELNWSRSAQAITLAISSLWMPCLAWSSFWPMRWSTRIAAVGSVMLAQAIFPTFYVVVDRTEDARYVVVRRGDFDLTPPVARKHDSTQVNNEGVNRVKDSTPTRIDRLLIPAPPASDWVVETHDGAVAERRTTDSVSQVNLVINRLGSAKPWQIQLVCPGVSVLAGKPFAFKFRAKANAPRPVDVAVQQNHAPGKNLGLYESISLTTEWKEYTFELSSPIANESNGRIAFQAGSTGESFDIDRLEYTPPPTGTDSPAMVTNEDGSPKPESRPPSNIPKPPAASSDSADPFMNWSVVSEGGKNVRTQFRNGTLSIQVSTAPGSENLPMTRWETRRYSLEQGRSYAIRFRARSTPALAIELAASNREPPHGNLGLFERIELHPEWRDLEYRFEATQSGSAWIHVNVPAPEGTIEFSSIQFGPAEPTAIP